MATALRKTGIDPVGDMPWGTNFCHFYETKDDLLDTLVPFFKCGLEDGEFCVWVVSEPLTEDDAWHALGRAVPGMARYLLDRSIEIFPAREWYLGGGKFDLQRVTSAWNEKLARALGKGYPGMRVSGNTAWLDKKEWRGLMGDRRAPQHIDHRAAHDRAVYLPAQDERSDGALGCGTDPSVCDSQAAGDLGGRRDPAAQAGEDGDLKAERRARAAGCRADAAARGRER